MSPKADEARGDRSRGGATGGVLTAVVLGVPLGAGLLALIHQGPLNEPLLQRYTSHPVEMVTVLLFGCALAALLTKLLALGKEWLALRADLLALWDGSPLPAEEAGKLHDQLRRAPRLLRNTYLGRRLTAVLDFVRKRGSADGLDDCLREHADQDEISLENSYSLVRFITWAIPILGFLGTVLGITDAVAGVTPEKLEKDLSQVTDGLSLAFDTTAVALALVMVVMFFTFLTERLEQTVLDGVTARTRELLAHRFARGGPDDGQYAAALQRHTDVLLRATDELVRRQAAIWAEALAAAQRQWLDAGRAQTENLAAGLEEALRRTEEGHARRLEAQEEQAARASVSVLVKLQELTIALNQSAINQQKALSELLAGMRAQTEMLARLAESGSQLLQLQETLQQNLHAVSAAGAFEEAVHSLTAAVHLLTARVGGAPPGNATTRIKPAA